MNALRARIWRALVWLWATLVFIGEAAIVGVLLIGWFLFIAFISF